MRPEYAEAAAATGRALAERGIGLVYGGGQLGLMGTLAHAAIEAGGHVVGVIPEFMIEKERAFHGASELVVVENMHQRKAEMAKRCDAILVLPGGIGTLDELFEALTWNQLGIQRKPVGILNVSGYYRVLEDLLDQAELEAFLPAATRESVTFGDDVVKLVEHLETVLHAM
jgi:hypothetical protein